MGRKFLIIGSGSIGQRHLRCLHEVPGTSIAVCDPDPVLRKQIHRQYDIPVFSEPTEAWRHGPFDAAVICAPAHLHVPLAQEALRNGCHLLIEKPLSLDLEGIQSLHALQRQTQRFIGVAYVQRFHPAIQQARRLLQAGRLGRVHQILVHVGQHFPSYRPAYREIYYARHETGGGAIQDALTHAANYIEWMVGPTDWLFCDAAHQCLEGVEVEDTVHLLARNNSVMVDYSLNQFQRPNEQIIQLHGTDASLRVETHRQRWGVFHQGDSDWTWYDAPVAERDVLFRAQAQAFLQGLGGALTDLCTLEEGVQSIQFNLAALESARTGKKVILTSFFKSRY